MSAPVLPVDLLGRVWCGHVLDFLRLLPEASVNCVVTSPPYLGLRDYQIEPVIWGGDPACEHEWQEELGGLRHENRSFRRGSQEGAAGSGPLVWVREQTDVPSWRCSRCGAWRGVLGQEPTVEQYVANLVQVFRELRRVLRRDGVAFLNLGDSYEGSRKGWSRRGYQYGSKQGTNAGSIRVPPADRGGLKAKDLIGTPWRVALALQADGWWLRGDIIWAKPNPMPESVKDRPTRAHEYVFVLTPGARYYWDWFAAAEPAASKGPLPPIGGSRKREGFQRASGRRDLYTGKTPDNTGLRNMRSVWWIKTAGTKLPHFAVFPPELARRCLLAGCPERVCAACGQPWRRRLTKVRTEPRRWSDGNTPGSPYEEQSSERTIWRDEGLHPACECGAGWRRGIVLDPFAGSGTTGVAAYRLGREFLGCDVSERYCEIANERLASERLSARLPV